MSAGTRPAINVGTVMPGFGLPIGDLIERVGFERRARTVGAVAGRRSIMFAPPPPRSDAGHCAGARARCRCRNVDAGDDADQPPADAGRGFRRPRSRAGRSIACAMQLAHAARYFHGIHYPRAFQIDGRSNTCTAWPRWRERAGVRIFEDTPVVSIDPVRYPQAHRDAVGDGCAPRTSCWPATCISARRCSAWRRRCCRSGAMPR